MGRERPRDENEAGTPDDAPEPEGLAGLFSVPRMVALAVLGVVIVGASRLLGTDVVFREVATEVIASLGSAILVLAVFGLLFGSGLERLLRRAPGGDVYAESARHMQEMFQTPGQSDRKQETAGYEARLDRIEEEVRSMANESLPDLKNRVEELRELLLKAERGTDDRAP